MDETTTRMHLAAGEHYGREATCGKKHDYKSEARADMAAHAVSLKHSDGKVLEAYPCFWCGGWHIGRAMTPDEQARFTSGDVTGHANEDCKSSVSGSTPDIASINYERQPGNVDRVPLSFIDDDGPTPYCLNCRRYLCRQRPGMENHTVVSSDDPRYPR